MAPTSHLRSPKKPHTVQTSMRHDVIVLASVNSRSSFVDLIKI